MNVVINNKQQIIRDNTNLQELIAHLNIQSKGIAIAINNDIVTKSNWIKTQLKEKDSITIITATQGG